MNKNFQGGSASKSIGSQVEGNHTNQEADAGPASGQMAPVSQEHPGHPTTKSGGSLPSELNTNAGDK